MLWFSKKTDKAVSIMQEIKQKAADIAKNQLNLATYQIREIRPEDLPSPSANDFIVGFAANTATRRVVRKVQSNSIVIIAGFYAPDVKNNISLIDPTGTGDSLEQPYDVTWGYGRATVKHVWFYRGTDLIRKWPLCPAFADEDAAVVTEGYVIYYPDDVIDIIFYCKDVITVEQLSQLWYLGIVLTPPGAIRATEASN